LNKITQPFDQSQKTATTELVYDITISKGTGMRSNPNEQYLGIDSSVALLNGKMNSSHMAKSLPAGGNILYMDGHADWRKFTDMHDPAWMQWQNVKYFWF